MEAVQFDLFDLEYSEEVLEIPSLESLQLLKATPVKVVEPVALPVPVKIQEPIALPTEPRFNYRIEDGAVFGPSGAKSKIKANINAIRILKNLEETDGVPDGKHCATLIQYSGWGGVPQVFDADKKDFQEEYRQLKELLTHPEYVSARASVLSSHYTPMYLVEFMWQLAVKAGFKGGEIGEFGAGIGHFIGLVPEGVNGHFTAVEIDDISGRIMKVLYLEENIIIKNLQQTLIKRDSLDLVIGNVPFDKVGVHDCNYVGYNLHNYFIARALDALKPGGLAILLTSASTMDSKVLVARANFGSRAALLAAIRLPNNAFSNAGTEVVSDILVLQKGAVSEEAFLNLEEVETHDHTGTMLVNEYFARHPENIMGDLSNTGHMYGRSGSPTVTPNMLKTLHIDRFEIPVQSIAAPEVDFFDDAPTEIECHLPLKEYALYVENGQVYQHNNGKGTLFTDKNGKEFTGNEMRKIRSFIEFKDVLDKLLKLQLDPDAPDQAIEVQRLRLNQHYDLHVKNFGLLNNKLVHRNVQEDPDYLKLAATENIRKEIETSLDGIRTQRYVYEKGDIYFKRTQFPWREPDTAENIVQAGMISHAYRHKIDLEYIGRIMNLSQEEAYNLLIGSGEFFENPVTRDIELKSKYLSGNVVCKLDIARNETDPKYRGNVEALEKVQPAPLHIEDIDFMLGSFWIPAEIIQTWLETAFNTECTVSYGDKGDRWFVNAEYRFRCSIMEYRIGEYDLFKLVETALNLKEPVIYKKVWDETIRDHKTIVDQDATLTVRQYKNELQERFRNYVLDSPETVNELENIYNSIFNSHVTRTYELPEFDVYPGAVSVIDGKRFVLRTHQKRAVSRCIEGNTLLAHCVGAGKTAVMITAVMEARRLRLATKGLIVVQNATLQQFAEFAPKLYPNAQILVATKKDLEKSKRRRFMSRIATGDWDIVIIAQSSFDMVKDNPDLVEQHYQEQIAELETVIAESESRDSIKEIERQKKQLEKILDRLRERKHEEDIIYFDELGIDLLIIDEVQAYKRNFFVTKMDRIKGLDRGASQRAFSLSLKIRHIMEKTGGRNVYTASGTPVSNVIGELWGMIRYVSPETLNEFNVNTFDKFSSVFTQTETALEIDAAGRFKMQTRFAKYSNVIELSKMFRTVADVVLSEELTEVERPPIKGGRPQQISLPRSATISQFMNYLQDVYEWFENQSDKRSISHIPLLIYGMSRKVTIDPRLIDHRFADDPGSKLNTCADKIIEKYYEYDSVKGTQIVFCDLYRNVCDKVEFFNAWNELKRKLIDGGIPAEEVAVINDYHTDKQKSELFERVNSGEVRVIIGSTSKLGTGVNIQERLAVEHDIDCPYRPSDVAQRSGRIHRQGNKIESIEVIRYGIEQTLDSGMYAILERKQKFINDAMKGRCARTVKEINDDTALDFASFSAAISGNPKLRRKVEIETRLKELDALERQHRRNVRYNSDQLAFLNKVIPLMKEELPRLERFAKTCPEVNYSDARIKYGENILTGNISEICKGLDELFERAYYKAVNQNGVHALNELCINGIRVQLIAKAALNYYNKLEHGKCCIQYQLKDIDIINLPVETSGEAREAGKLLYNIRKMIAAKPEELAQSRIELEAKTAKLEKLQSAPPEKFSSSEEKSKLTVELDQIIFDLNKTSEGQRDSYISNEMPELRKYFPELSNTGIIREIEVLESADDEEEMAQSA